MKFYAVLLTLALISCNHYRSYKITEDLEVKRYREGQKKYKHKRLKGEFREYSTKNFTYHIPERICMENDTVTLKKCADIIFKLNTKKIHHLDYNIKYLNITSDTTGYFEDCCIKIRDGYLVLLYNKKKRIITFREGPSF